MTISHTARSTLTGPAADTLWAAWGEAHAVPDATWFGLLPAAQRVLGGTRPPEVTVTLDYADPCEWVDAYVEQFRLSRRLGKAHLRIADLPWSEFTDEDRRLEDEFIHSLTTLGMMRRHLNQQWPQLLDWAEAFLGL